jgi:hypothetical protein
MILIAVGNTVVVVVFVDACVTAGIAFFRFLNSRLVLFVFFGSVVDPSFDVVSSNTCVC